MISRIGAVLTLAASWRIAKHGEISAFISRRCEEASWVSRHNLGCIGHEVSILIRFFKVYYWATGLKDGPLEEQTRAGELPTIKL